MTNTCVFLKTSDHRGPWPSTPFPPRGFFLLAPQGVSFNARFSCSKTRIQTLCSPIQKPPLSGLFFSLVSLSTLPPPTSFAPAGLCTPFFPTSFSSVFCEIYARCCTFGPPRFLSVYDKFNHKPFQFSAEDPSFFFLQPVFYIGVKQTNLSTQPNFMLPTDFLNSDNLRVCFFPKPFASPTQLYDQTMSKILRQFLNPFVLLNSSSVLVPSKLFARRSWLIYACIPRKTSGQRLAGP